MIEFGFFKKKYKLTGIEIPQIKEVIVDNLNDRKADEIEVSSVSIYFNNHIYRNGRTNQSLMSVVDAGSFHLFKDKEGITLIAYFSVKRIMFLVIIVLFIIIYEYKDDLFYTILPCVLFLSMIFVSILRYLFFLREIIESLNKNIKED